MAISKFAEAYNLPFSSSVSQETSRLLFQVIMSNLRVSYLRHECMFNEKCQVVLPEAVIVQPDMTYFMRSGWPRSDSNAHNCKIKARQFSQQKESNDLKDSHYIFISQFQSFLTFMLHWCYQYFTCEDHRTKKKKNNM